MNRLIDRKNAAYTFEALPVKLSYNFVMLSTRFNPGKLIGVFIFLVITSFGAHSQSSTILWSDQEKMNLATVAGP